MIEHRNAAPQRALERDRKPLNGHQRERDYRKYYNNNGNADHGGAHRVDLPHDVAMFIAERVRSNIRELEGHLNKVAMYASLAGRPITVDLTKEALKDLLTKDNKPITVNDILKVVATHYGIKVSELKQKSNARIIAYPRQVAMYLCKELTDMSYPEIGKAFNNKHHSTVMYSVERVSEMMEDDQDLARTLSLLASQIR